MRDRGWEAVLPNVRVEPRVDKLLDLPRKSRVGVKVNLRIGVKVRLSQGLGLRLS